MTNSDLILYFANKYITEKEKNLILQQELKQVQEDIKAKTNLKQ